MNTIKVVNIKCGGCAHSIRKALENQGFENVSVDESKMEVSFEGDCWVAVEILSKMGYPEVGSKEAESLIKKAKSYISCARGKMSKKD
jgi:copper chaperone